MTRKEEYTIAKANGCGKSYLDSKIGEDMLKELAPAEENARMRKAILVLVKAIDDAKIPYDKTQVTDLLDQTKIVKQVKNKVYEECGVKEDNA